MKLTYIGTRDAGVRIDQEHVPPVALHQGKVHRRSEANVVPGCGVLLPSPLDEFFDVVLGAVVHNNYRFVLVERRKASLEVARIVVRDDDNYPL